MNRKTAAEIIGVDLDADADTVRKAAAEALMRDHPDHGGTGENLAAIRQAKEVLLEEPHPCKTCNGRGVIRIGWHKEVCPICRGEGKTYV